MTARVPARRPGTTATQQQQQQQHAPAPRTQQQQQPSLARPAGKRRSLRASASGDEDSFFLDQAASAYAKGARGGGVGGRVGQQRLAVRHGAGGARRSVAHPARTRRPAAPAGVATGKDEDELVAESLGGGKLSDVQQQYSGAIKKKLEEVGAAHSGGGALPAARRPRLQQAPTHPPAQPFARPPTRTPTQRAEELRRQREERAAKFQLGKLAYERGQYASSVQLLEAALSEEGPFRRARGGV